MQKKEFSTEIGGKTLTATFSDLTDQANGSVMLKYGETTVLATAVMSSEKREGFDFFPLTVDYEEKFYAAGQILGSKFMRREGRPSDEAILSSRVIDRTIRPLFDSHIRNEIQVVITVLSIDKDDPDILALNASSLAIAVSDIPWNGPVSAVRIGKLKGGDEFMVNPDYEFRRGAELGADFIISGNNGHINMVEGGAEEIEESLTGDIFRKASEEIEKFQEFQNKIVSEIGKEKQIIDKEVVSEETKKIFQEKITPKLKESVFNGKAGKDGIHTLKTEWKEILKADLPDEKMSLAMDLYEDAVNDILHLGAIEEDKRADGRKMNELRELYAQAGGISSVLHGSGIFYRGGTHIFSALTLGAPDDAQIIDGMEIRTEKRFMHHYNFPPFSSGETGRMGGTNRRMIGHGALAERAISAVIPSKEKFPYTIRIVSESMASNGSTSMGSVCGSTLALMDAGVPIKAPVAGIAMGLMMSEDGSRYKVLTDIQGPEDHHGDMDFKVAGTRNGVTAIQMDIKVGGIPIEVLVEALDRAKEARVQILDVIEGEISSPRADISPSAPKILSLKIAVDQIGMVIGPGGKVINGIKADTKVESIAIEDDGMVFITGKNGTAEEAYEIINDMTREYHVGEKFEGEVVRILDFGAVMRIGRTKEGLVHISEIAPFRIEKVSDVLSLGEKVPVIIKEVEDGDKLRLSIKEVDPQFASKKGVKPAPPSEHGSNNRHGSFEQRRGFKRR